MFQILNIFLDSWDAFSFCAHKISIFPAKIVKLLNFDISCPPLMWPSEQMVKNFVRHSRKVGQDWSVVAPDPLTMDGKSWRDVSLGDTLEEILLPKRPLTRRERMNLPDEVSAPPSSPCSSPSPPKLQPATRKSRKRNLINWSLYWEYFNYWIIHYQSLLRWGQR